MPPRQPRCPAVLIDETGRERPYGQRHIVCLARGVLADTRNGQAPQVVITGLGLPDMATDCG
jgi:hypothetical protein